MFNAQLMDLLPHTIKTSQAHKMSNYSHEPLLHDNKQLKTLIKKLMEFVDLVGLEPTSCMINSSPHIVPQRMAKLPMDAVRYEILRQLEIPKLIQDSVWANYILFDKTHFKPTAQTNSVLCQVVLKTYSSCMFDHLIRQQFIHPCQSVFVPHWLMALCDKSILMLLKIFLRRQQS